MHQFPVLIVVLTLVCQTHQTLHKYHRDPTAQSCLDYFKKGYTTNGYYQINNNGAGNTFRTVYCDLESEPGFAWTLVESFSLQNKAMIQFLRHTLKTNAQVRPKAPNWNLYRMSLVEMEHLKKQSTHWRFTCDFPAKPVDLYRDYAVARFKDFDVLSFTGLNACKLMEYINIRGHHCAECTIGWYAIHHSTAGQSLHVASSTSTSCQLKPKEGAVAGEQNFGRYVTTNNKFRCTSSPNATTNLWIGGFF